MLWDHLVEGRRYHPTMEGRHKVIIAIGKVIGSLIPEYTPEYNPDISARENRREREAMEARILRNASSWGATVHLTDDGYIFYMGQRFSGAAIRHLGVLLSQDGYRLTPVTSVDELMPNLNVTQHPPTGLVWDHAGIWGGISSNPRVTRVFKITKR